MHDTNPHEQQRQVRGFAIASIDSCIKRINKLRYKVKSQSDAWKWYEVVKQYGHNIGGHQEGEWTCDCPDFEYRHLVCKRGRVFKRASPQSCITGCYAANFRASNSRIQHLR